MSGRPLDPTLRVRVAIHVDARGATWHVVGGRPSIDEAMPAREAAAYVATAKRAAATSGVPFETIVAVTFGGTWLDAKPFPAELVPREVTVEAQAPQTERGEEPMGIWWVTLLLDIPSMGQTNVRARMETGTTSDGDHATSVAWARELARRYATALGVSLRTAE